MAGGGRRLHAPGLRADLARGRRLGAALRRLGVPVPLFAIRHLRPRPSWPGAQQPYRAPVPVRRGGPTGHRLKQAGETVARAAWSPRNPLLEHPRHLTLAPAETPMAPL